jgi:hypothetical protein
MKDDIEERFKRNLARVENLLKVYKSIGRTGKGRQQVNAGDVLRSATVFLHATLEDFLRSMATWKLPGASVDVLNGVPLVGLNTHGRPEKFSLGALAAHSGKTVQDVIRESVIASLERETYNDTGEISKLLTSIGLQPGQLNGQFPTLAEMMSRRHHIVHRADANPNPGTGHHHAKSIGVKKVKKWVSAVEEFITAVLGKV